MRRTLMIALILSLLSIPEIMASAQGGLHSGWVFENGSKVDKHKLETSVVKGERLKEYKLNLFHSIKLCCTPSEYREISQSVMADSNNATDKELEISGGNVKYALLRFEGENGINSYLAMQLTSHSTYIKDETTVTDAFLIVYMEGEASIPELRALFSKKQ